METDKIFALLSGRKDIFTDHGETTHAQVNCVVVTKDQGTNNWEAESQDQS